MKTVLLLAIMLCMSVFAFGQRSDSESGRQDLSTTGEPPMLGIHWALGFDPFARAHEAHSHGGGSSALMTYHGGKIMPDAVTKNIFWGTSWSAYTGDEITGLDAWYSGFGNSHYAQTSDEYTGSNGKVSPVTTHQGHVIDASPSSGGGSTSAILAEVCKVITSPDSSGNG